MYSVKADIPQQLCNIDDELKAIYHSKNSVCKDSVCFFILKTREDRNKFMDETVGMKKQERESYYDSLYELN